MRVVANGAVPLAIGAFTLLGVAGAAEAVSLTPTTLAVPINVEGEDQPTHIYLRLPSQEIDAPRESFIRDAGAPAADAVAHAAGTLLRALVAGTPETYERHWPPSAGKASQRAFEFDRRHFERVNPTHVVRRYLLGNLHYFVLDATPYAGSSFPLLILEDGSGALVGTSFLINPLVQLVTAAEGLRSRGGVLSEETPSTGKGSEWLALDITPRFLVDHGRQVLLDNPGKERAELIFKAQLYNSRPADALQVARERGTETEAIRFYDELHAALQKCDQEAWLEKLGARSRGRAEKWLQKAPDRFKHYCWGQTERRRLRAVIDGGAAGWIFVHQRNDVRPRWLLSYDLIRWSEERKRFELVNYDQKGLFDWLFSFEWSARRLAAALGVEENSEAASGVQTQRPAH